MLSIGQIREICEKYVKKDINPELFRDILDAKLKDFANQTGCLQSSATLDSVADTQEYELPEDCLNVYDVIYDDYRAQKILHSQVKELQGQS